MSLDVSDKEIMPQEYQPSFVFFLPEIQNTISQSIPNGDAILNQALILSNLPLKDLKRRIGVLSAITDPHSLSPDIAAVFLALDERPMSQLATLAEEHEISNSTLEEIATSAVGIKVEILLRHIENFVSKNPYEKFFLGKTDGKLLYSKLEYLEQIGDFSNLERIKALLEKTRTPKINVPVQK